MKRWALVDDNTHTVKNIIIWDGKSNFEPPSGTYLVDINSSVDGSVWGEVYNKETGTWSDPIPPESVSETTKPTLEELQKQLELLTAQISAYANT